MTRNLAIAAIITAVSVTGAEAQSHLHISSRHQAHLDHIQDALRYHANRHHVVQPSCSRTAYVPPVRIITARVPVPAEIRFGGFSHVDDLAVELEELTKSFCLDLYYNYSHNVGFRETYAEAYQIFEVAKYIHNLEHYGDRNEIRRRLTGLDALFHHVEDDVAHWSRHHRVQVGALGIMTKLEQIEEALHHLMEDVGVASSLPEPPAPFGVALTEPPVPSLP